jgi:hypothetical protein
MASPAMAAFAPRDAELQELAAFEGMDLGQLAALSTTTATGNLRRSNGAGESQSDDDYSAAD